MTPTTDRSVVATVSLKLKRPQRQEVLPPRLSKLHGQGFNSSSQLKSRTGFLCLSNAHEVEHDWCTFRNEMNAAAMATVDTVQHTGTRKDRLTAETFDLVHQKRSARLAGKTGC